MHFLWISISGSPACNNWSYFKSTHDAVVIHRSSVIIISSLSFIQVEAVKPVLKFIKLSLKLFIEHLNMNNIHIQRSLGNKMYFKQFI